MTLAEGFVEGRAKARRRYSGLQVSMLVTATLTKTKPGMTQPKVRQLVRM